VTNGAGRHAGSRSHVAPPFALVESKLVPPPRRPGLVERERLVKRIAEAEGCSVIAVVAPAGYGKSTLLAEWAADQPRVGWVSIDKRDNDPAVLLTYLAVAVDRIEPIDVVFGRWRASLGVGIADVGELVAAIGSMSGPVALVLDQAEAITNRSARDVIAELAIRLPAGCRLAIGSRHEAPVPTARLRAQRALVEIGAPELGMNRVEAGELLAWAGVAVPDDAVDDLHRQTEGWAAGLYLAALALNAGGGGGIPAARDFSGDDRFMGDYLRSEFLSNASLLTYALPIMSAQTLLELARAYIALGDRSGGRAVLRQLFDILQHRPQLGTIANQAGDLRSRLESLGAEMLGVSSLTTAELRLLPLLLTHLSQADIGERLFLSRNTVKSHTKSIYRKLGVTSRGETINKMLELGVVSNP